MAHAIHITPEGEILPLELPTDGEYEILRDTVGGLLDSVPHPDLPVVGYVHDEGLLIGLEPNIMATLFFGRPLVGPVVVVGVLSPEGEYDGDSHDVPEGIFTDEFRESLATLAGIDGIQRMVGAMCETALNTPPTVTSLTDAEFDAWLEGR